MKAVVNFIKTYWVAIAIAVAVVILFVVFSSAWKNNKNSISVTDANGNPVTFTDAQQQEAKALAQRIYADLSSGWMFGYNLWGNIGRDSDAYWKLAAMSDAMFTLTAQHYQQLYNSSMIADLRAEGSLPGDTYMKTILAKAEKLNLT